MSEHFEVRFVCYQYDCGGRGSNGWHKVMKKFTDLENAKKFAAKIKNLSIGNLIFDKEIQKRISRSSNFAKQYVYDGYVQKMVGLFKITEEKIEWQ